MPLVFTPAVEHWHQSRSSFCKRTSLQSLTGQRVLKKFTRSQHCFVYHTTKVFLSMPSMPVKRWNFARLNGVNTSLLTNKFAKTLLPPDSLDVNAAYQDFCNIIKKAAKKKESIHFSHIQYVDKIYHKLFCYQITYQNVEPFLQPTQKHSFENEL